MSDPLDRLHEARDTLKADGVRFVQIEVSEIDGALRGKLLPIDKGLGGEIGFSTVLYGLTTADDVYEAPFTSYDNGFLDYFARPHLDTLRRLPWHPETVAVICDFHDADGTMTPECPRTALRKAVGMAARLGFEPRIAVEFEVSVFRADEAALAAKRYDALAPVSRTRNAYSLLRMPELRALFEAFMGRMSDIGEPLESTHSELGRCAVEFALSHAPPLDAADRAMRAKTYFKELCAEQGLVASFMAKIDLTEPGLGAHVHQSLWRDGANVFWDGEDVSETARHYAAGQLAHLPALTVLCKPTINSYRRAGWEHWVPENASWGLENRAAAVRLVTHPTPHGVRFENRLPGADANAYLTIAGLLAAGLDGVERRLEPPPLCRGNAALDPIYERLPTTLEEATRRFKDSDFPRRVFGDRFVDHYALSREVEIKVWREWQRSHVSAWELERYFETI